MWRSSLIDRFVVRIDSKRVGLNGETRKAALNQFGLKPLASRYTMNDMHPGKLEIVFKFRQTWGESRGMAIGGLKGTWAAIIPCATPSGIAGCQSV
jgi:hypothetical protein